MAILVWQSTTGSLTGAASWGGTALTASDTGLFQKTNITPVTSDLDLGANTANLVTYPGYSGDIGSPGAGLLHATSLGRHIHRGSGTFYYGNNVISQVAIGSFVVDAPLAGHDAAVLNGVIGDVYVKSGRVTLGPQFDSSGAGATKSIAVYGIDSRLKIEVGSAGQAGPDQIRLIGGQIIDEHGFTLSTQSLIIKGGTMLETGLIAASMRVYIMGGTLIYNPATDPSGETPHFFVEGGVLDVRDSAFVIPTIQVVVGPNGTVLGNAVDTTGSFTDIDLSQDYP